MTPPRKQAGQATGRRRFEGELLDVAGAAALSVAIWVQMDSSGSNTFPVGFGDLRRGYTLNDIATGALRIVKDEVTVPGLVKFYVRRRTGGNVVDNHAVKFLKTV